MEMGKFIALAGLLLAATSGHAADAPPIPERPDLKRYEQVPAPWREYLLKAREAERIADPLQRCLLFPDIPNNEWPAGHAQAHCRHHFAAKRPTLDEIAGMVERGEVVKLEEMFDRALAHHAPGDGADESIHDTFNYLLTSKPDNDRIGQITESWLKQAPESAYANLARGAYFNGAAWKARGGKYAEETPKEALRRMSELVEQAIPYFRKAISINPKLMPAYTGMIDLGMMDSRPELGANAIAQGEKIDPTCVELANVRMRSLKPRWGGSYEEMLAYASRLTPYVAQRPHLAVHVAEPFADRGDRLIAAEEYTREALQILEIAIATGSDEDALHDAADVAGALKDGEPDLHKRLVYLLQEARFREVNSWAMRELAGLLVQSEPEWSLEYSLPALESSDDGRVHFLAGLGYGKARRFEDAEREYRIAIENREQRQVSLQEAASMWLYDAGLTDREAAAKAEPYIDRLSSEYPENGRGSVMRWYQQAMESGKGSVDSIRAVIPKLDRDDPWQAYYIEWFENLLATVKQPSFHFKLKEE